MKRIPRRLTPHTVHVQPHVPGGFGQPDTWGPEVEVPDVQVVDRTLAIQRGASSSEVTSSAQVGANAGDGDYVFRAQDRVTLWKGTPRERTEEVRSVDYGPKTGALPPQQIATLT